MHILGKDLVSTATQKSARQLVATALTVFLAKFYGVDLKGLQIFEVPIDPKVVAGAAFIVVAFQLVTFVIHWGGDFVSLAPWNSSERFTDGRWLDFGGPMVDRMVQMEQRLTSISDEAQKKLQGQADQAAIDRLTAEVRDAKAALQGLRRSAIKYGRYGFLYFYGLYLALPFALAIAALLWCSPNA